MSADTAELVIVLLTPAPWILFIGAALWFSAAAVLERRREETRESRHEAQTEIRSGS